MSYRSMHSQTLECQSMKIYLVLRPLNELINSIVDPYLSWIAQLVRALVYKAKGPGSSPGPE